jgi:hypothetical protein
MEVQSQQSGQVTVNWTTSTSFSQTVTTALASVKVGDCLTVTGTTKKGTTTAKSVTISAAKSGKCTGAGGFGGAGFGGAGGSRPSGSQGFTPPSGGEGSPEAGSGSPTRGTTGIARGFGATGFASGKVTKVSGQNVVLSGFSSGKLNKKSAKKSAKTGPVKIKVTSSTTYTESQMALASDVAVGECVTASGSTGSTGTVTASTVRITSTGGKTCTASGFPGAVTGG